MENQTQANDDLADEFRRLGENLKEVLQAAWESDERLRVQKEIQAGLAELEATLKETSDEFTQGESGQRIKAEVEDLRARLRSGELQSRIRQDLLGALNRINAELQSLSSTWSTSKQDPSGERETTGDD